MPSFDIGPVFFYSGMILNVFAWALGMWIIARYGWKKVKEEFKILKEFREHAGELRED